MRIFLKVLSLVALGCVGVFLLVCLLIAAAQELRETKEKTRTEAENLVIKAIEQGYFQGQKDALKGKYALKMVSDSCAVWTASPWDSGRKPIYKEVNTICK